MNVDKRRLFSSLISLLVLTSMLLGMISPLSSLDLASAQETTPEPTPEITPEAPTPETTDLPVPTPEATQPPVAPTPDLPVTPEVPPILPIDPTVYQEDFQDGDASGWLLSPNWALATVEGNTYLTTTGAFETATVTGLVGENVAISTKFGLEAGNTANIAFRVGADNYNVTLNAEGRVSLYQGLTLLVEGAPASEVTPESAPTINTYVLGIQAVGGLITVTVDGTAQITYTAPTPLPAGMVIFSTGQANTGTVTLDDIRIELLPASVLPPVEPATAVPTPELPLIEVTPEVTIETTPEATLEATPEATVEPEITPEAPSGPTPILSADFEGELLGWTLSETGASVIDGEDNNFLAVENGTFAPDSALFLTDFRIDGRANFTSGAFSIVFRSSEGRAYTLVVAADSTSLSREGDATDTESTPEATAEATAETPTPATVTLVTVPAARSAEAWYTISLEAVGGTITFSVDGVTELTFTDENALLGGTFAISGAADSYTSLDDIAVYDLADGLPTVVTPAPITLTDENKIKLGGALANIMQAYVDGDEEFALAQSADYFLAQDEQNRLEVMVWGTPDLAGEAVAALVEANDGLVQSIDGRSVKAFVSLDAILTLINQDTIAAVMMPERAVSTDSGQSEAPSEQAAIGGVFKPHSLDILGVNSWHTYLGPDGTAAAGVTGQGITVAVIDTGYAGASAGGEERGCLGSTFVDGGEGGTNHGLNVVEVICDIAPGAQVYMYRAGSTAELTTAINKANGLTVDNFPTANVIVITIDTGLGGGGDVSGAITNAFNLNIPVIASAGNTGNSGSGAFDFVSDTNLGIQASAGTVISYAWDDPTGTNNYPSTLSLDGTTLDSRQVPLDDASYQYVVPASCGDSCDLILAIDGTTPTKIEVQAAGGNGDNVVTYDDFVTPLAATSSLTSAAQAPNAIAVGAVCTNNNSSERYPLVSNSSRGADAQANDGNIKPEVVAPSFVNTSLFGASVAECENYGFGGTSAAAAHVAGMAALLFSNTSNINMAAYFSSNRPQNLERYLMTRTIDLNASVDSVPAANLLGFDPKYGAGLTVLGNPNFNMSEQVNFPGFAQPTGFPASALDSEAVYVGTAVLPTSGPPNGSPGNPYVSVIQALAATSTLPAGQRYVVFQPGEYVSGYQIPAPLTSSLTLISYSEADLSVTLPSQIWVADMPNPSEGTGAIVILGVGSPSINVTINGFNFIGSSPLYEVIVPSGNPGLLLEDLTPLLIKNSTNIDILNNTFDNFDSPVFIENTQDVLLDNNTFSRFISPFEIELGTQGRLIVVATASAGALNIIDSGNSAANSVRIYNNAFLSNNIFSEQFSSPIQKAIVRIERSYVDIRSTRFEDNIAQSIITVNQWIAESVDTTKPLGSFIADRPVTIFSSLFDSNILNGSLIQLYQQPQFRFVNNTVVNHDLVGGDPSANSSVILVGRTDDTEFNHISDHRFQIHNNLFFNNEVDGSLLSAIVSNGSGLGDEGCKQTGPVGGADPRNGAQNNWFIPAIPMGECLVSTGGGGDPLFTGTGLNSNQFTYIPIQRSNDPPEVQAAAAAAVSAFQDARFFMAYDPDNPYRLRPLDINDPNNATPPQGVDAGNNTLAMAIIGTYDNLLTLDVMRLPRIIDRTGPLPFNETPGPTNGIIDIGAYELSIAKPVAYTNVTGAITVSAAEDTRAITFRIDQEVEGGFRPYTFIFSNPPTIYDTNPNNACGGQPYAYNPIGNDPDSRYLVTYCPPANFFTQGVPVSVTLTYQAYGLIVTTPTAPATVTFNITQIDDANPPPIVTQKQVVFTQIGTALNYRLRPYVNFNPNFSLSDTANNDVDYLWTFSTVVPKTGAGESSLNWQTSFGVDETATRAALNAAVASGTLTGLTPQPGWEGVVEFTYTVTDGQGQSRAEARRVRIVVTRKLAGPGVHDDSSLDFVYQDGWIPFFYEPGINNTLHYTTTQNASTSFYFIGDAFLIRYYGFLGAANFQLLLDPDDTGPMPELSYNTTGAGGFDLDCSIANPPTNISTSQTLPGFYTFGCEGLNNISISGNTSQDQLHRLTIKNVSATNPLAPQYFILDAVTVRGEALTPGVYEDTDTLALNFTNNWLSYAGVGPAGGSSRYTFTPAANVTFQVDGDAVDNLIVYRTLGPGAGDMNVYVNGALRRTIRSNYPIYVFNQAEVITNIPGGIVSVEIRSMGSAAVGIEAIELVEPQTPLLVGTVYPGEDERIRYVGPWYNYVAAGPSNGTLRYSNDLNANAVFNIDGNGVVVNYTKAVGYGQFEVCVSTSCQIFDGNSAATVFGAPGVVRSGTTGIQTVTIRNVNGAYVGIDSIEVLGAQPSLTPGLYQENDRALAYSGQWYPYSFSLSQGGTFVYTNPGTTQSLSFLVNASQMDRLVIVYPKGPSYGTMQVCGLGAACTTIAQLNGTYTFQNAMVILKSTLGLTNQTSATVTLRSSGGGSIGVEAIQVLAPRGPLKPNYYEETEFGSDYNITYNGTDSGNDGYGGWTPYATTNLRGGSMVYTNSTTATATFGVIPADISGIVLYYTTGAGYGTMQLFSGGACNVGTTCFEVPNIAGACCTTGRAIFIPKASLGLAGSTTEAQLTLRTKNNGEYIGLEAIQIIDADPLANANDPLTTLPAGQVTAFDTRLQYVGPWAAFGGAGPTSNTLAYSNDVTAALRFKINGQGVAVYRTQAVGYGLFEICIDGNICQIFNNTAAGTYYGRPAVLRAPTNGIHVVDIRNVSGAFGLAGSYIGIETIETIGAQTTLPVGSVIEETNLNLTYSGTGWIPFFAPGAQGGTEVYTSDTTSQISFQANATQFDRIVIYHPIGTGVSSLRVCGPNGTSCVNTTTAAGATIFGRSTVIPKADLGLTNQTNATVTIKNLGVGAAGLEGLQLLAAAGPLAPGYYEETNASNSFNITYNGTDSGNDGYGGWTPLALVGTRGGSMVYTSNQAATATFQLIPNNIAGIVIYYTTGPGYANMEVCNGATCVLAQNAVGALTYVNGNRLFIPKASLNLTGGTAQTVTLRTQTNGLFVGLEALHIISTDLASNPSNLPTLPAGRTPANSTNLRYIGNWLTLNTPEPIDDVLRYSNDPTASVMFEINGEGVAVYRVLFPGYGPFEICIDGNICQQYTSASTVASWNQTAFLRAPTAGRHIVEIRNLGTTYIGIESIEVLAAQTPLSLGYHEETDLNLEYATGPWTTLSAVGPRGGSLIYTDNAAAVLSFQVDAAAVQGIRVFFPVGNSGTPATSWVGIKVCNGATCVESTTQPLPYLYAQSRLFTRAELGLGAGTTTIQISRGATAGFIGIEAIEIRGTAGPISVGYYEQDDFNIARTLTWTDATSTLYSGGTAMYTNQVNATASFQLAANATGFSFFAARTQFAGAIKVCYQRAGDPTPTCPTDTKPINAFRNALAGELDQYFYGYAFYGLRTGATTTVTITNLAGGTGGGYLLIDAISVIGQTSTTLQIPAGQVVARFDDNNPAILYGPDALWVSTFYPGYYQNTLNYTANTGAVAQFRILGNSVTVYQASWSAGSRNVRFCTVLDTPINNLDCSDYSQNDLSAAVLQSPVTLYGFGTGTHELVLENKDYGFYFIIDALEVR